MTGRTAASLDGLAPAALFSLAGRTAIVTGAAGGIGRWLTAGFAGAGARVLATDADTAALEELIAWLGPLAAGVHPFPADLVADDAPARIIDVCVERLGGVDILVNNAGVNRRVPMLELDRELHERIWLVDYQRCYELSQLAARRMVEQGRGGVVLQVSSLNNAMGLEDVSALGPTKAALSQLAKVMTVELARFGIRSNAIAPGFMDTPMNAGHWTHPTRAPWILSRTPMARPGHPAELVGAALWLASDAGSFVSGQTVYVDGGLTAGSRWNVDAEEGLRAYERWRTAGSPIWRGSDEEDDAAAS